MPTWTKEQLRDYEARRLSPGAKPEQAVRHEPVAAAAGETTNPGRIRVRVTRFGRRLLDPDNVCAKYFIDCLRYCGYIPDDREEDIALEVGQRKVKLISQERTEIEIIAEP